MTVEEQAIDITPTPRVLAMLGEINLEPWRCIAELVDNSIDAFMEAAEEGVALNPQISITIPVSDGSGGSVRVKDNGPGMSREQLRNSVRAGWTSHEPFERLGLFGMGFNIATARLGRTTTIWTVREEDFEWIGMEIDFDKLIRRKDFKTKLLTRPKLDIQEHGTEVTIAKLKEDQRAWLRKAHNRTNLKRILSRIYSTMMESRSPDPIGVRIYLNEKKLFPHKHCVWGDDPDNPRYGSSRRLGKVPAYMEFDHPLGQRFYCLNCWRWLSPEEESKCAECQSSDHLRQRTRAVRGWLAIQRYVHPSEYGIDFIRHGRKIEMDNKDLFYWDDGTQKEMEYPISDPRSNGRIVGEVHIDHCRVNYTKERFDRSDPAWAEMVRFIRGDGPLRPKIAEQQGFPANTSRLFQLRNVFERTTPQNIKSPEQWENILAVHKDLRIRAEEMARYFQKGEPEYQSDDKWWELIEETKRLIAFAPEEEPRDGPIDNGRPEGPEEEQPDDEDPPAEQRPLHWLSRRYEYEAGLYWDVESFDVDESHPDLIIENSESIASPWRFKVTTPYHGVYLVNTTHEVFTSVTLTPLDALLYELSFQVFETKRGTREQPRICDVLRVLRKKYAAEHSLDSNALMTSAENLFEAVTNNLKLASDGDNNQDLFQNLKEYEQLFIFRKIAQSRISNHPAAIKEGVFFRYLTPHMLIDVLDEHPEMFFDGKCWTETYSDIHSERDDVIQLQRSHIRRYYMSLMNDWAWLLERSTEEPESVDRPELIRASLAINLLENNLKYHDSEVESE